MTPEECKTKAVEALKQAEKSLHPQYSERSLDRADRWMQIADRWLQLHWAFQPRDPFGPIIPKEESVDDNPR